MGSAPVRVGIVGCGLVGKKRAAALGSCPLVRVADLDRSRAEMLAAAMPGSSVSPDWKSLVSDPAVEAVIVATTNDQLTPVALAAVEAGKHVLVEKPAARSASELSRLAALAAKRGTVVKVGFNHRFHPAIMEARRLVDAGEIGPLMYLRARYGHGGRLGYEKEWRADPGISGGGELIDQGVHLVDLARCFLGEFAHVSGWTPACFWKMPVEDNAFLCLQTTAGQIAWLHASCTEWKNLFSLEIYGKTGKLQVDGLGGSYGQERLTCHRMLPQMGPPETRSREYPLQDRSWELEFQAFADAVGGRPANAAGLADAMAVLRIVDRIYGRDRE